MHTFDKQTDRQADRQLSHRQTASAFIQRGKKLMVITADCHLNIMQV